jgi:hypothetical protein
MPMKEFKFNHRFPGTKWFYQRDLPNHPGRQRRVGCRCDGCGNNYARILSTLAPGKSTSCENCGAQLRAIRRRSRRVTFRPGHKFPGTRCYYLRDLPDNAHGARMVEYRCGGCERAYPKALQTILTLRATCCPECSYQAMGQRTIANRRTFKANHQFAGTEWFFLRDLPDNSFGRRVECRCGGCGKSFSLRTTGGLIRNSKCCLACSRRANRSLVDYEWAFNLARAGAKTRNLAFTLSFAWFLKFIKDNPFCANPKCLRPLKWEPRVVGPHHMDRVVNSKTYNPRNIQALCPPCQMLKGGHTQQWFLRFFEKAPIPMWDNGPTEALPTRKKHLRSPGVKARITVTPKPAPRHKLKDLAAA